MDQATIIGIVAGCFLVTLAILLGGEPAIFINIQGILVVLGGTCSTTLIRFPMSQCFGMFQVVKQAFITRTKDAQLIIEEILQLARKSRQEGILSLESYESDNHFLLRGIQLLVDGNEPHEVEEILRTDIDYLRQRHENGQDILKAIGEAAPAFGMIGTLIGLVIMLSNMEDVKALGPAMAVAILTTLYGAVIANLIALPIAKKLDIRSREESLNRELLLVGLLGISEQKNPRIIETQLKAFLSSSNVTEGEEPVEDEEAQAA